MYNEDDKKVNFTIKLSMNEARQLLNYLNDEFIESYGEFLKTLENELSDGDEEFEYYESIQDIMEDVIYDLGKEIRKKERMSLRNSDEEILEYENIKKKLNPYSVEILKKIEALKLNIELPILYKIYWYLHDSYDKSGEIIFAQNSLEDLLGLDRTNLEKLLEKLSKIEIKIGNRKGRIIENYKLLNSTTIKINYNVYIVNPHTAVFRDKNFKLEGLEKIIVNYL